MLFAVDDERGLALEDDENLLRTSDQRPDCSNSFECFNVNRSATAVTSV